jgi:hypothetical protein
MSRPYEALRSLARRIGLDHAILYTVLARGVSILVSTGTVLWITYCMNPVEQGYYYTLLSLVSLQIVFELGFSFVVLQMAAHTCVELTFLPGGRIEGSEAARWRLASLLRTSLHWYLGAGAVMLLLLPPAGYLFFMRHRSAAPGIGWQWPWMLAALACVLFFIVNPIFSFLEGCGQVRQVALMRFCQALAVPFFSWSVIIAHKGLFSPGLVIVAQLLVAGGFLFTRRRLLWGLLRMRSQLAGVHWRREIWPFQWKIAISWLCSYFTMQIFIPILFAVRGPREAGQMGMSLSIIGYLGTFMLAWINTKAPSFGNLVAQGNFAELDELFFLTLRQALALLLILCVLCETGLLLLDAYYARLGQRLVSPAVLALLLLAGVSSFVIQSMAIYLRSFRREPYLYQSLTVAALTLVFSWLLARPYGNTGVALSYFFCTGIVGLLSAGAIFVSWRRRHTRPPEAAFPEGGPA